MKDKLNILLLGNGGRECAIAHKLCGSPRLQNIYIAPANAAGYAQNLDLDPCDFPAVKKAVDDLGIDMIVVGPEKPLVQGITDFFANEEVKVIGPSAQGAMLEGSKEFAKEFMFRNLIPTARFMSVTHDTLEEGLNFIDSLQPPYVLKADGLAAGKGVVILDSPGEAKDTLHEMLDGMFGEASSTVVIEEYLHGIECSVFVITDGKDYKILPVAKDYKRVGEGDTGPNTGGMGAVSPVPFADEEFMRKVEKQIVVPTIRGLQQEGIDYRGFIFLGLMNVEGDPMVIEYNCRMGDPETEVVMPRISSDLVDLLEGVAEETLAQKSLSVDPRAAATVMLVSGGYPGAYTKGKKIEGTEQMPQDVTLYHAGTCRTPEGELQTAGGRVLAVTAYADDIHAAADKALQAAADIKFEGKYNRTDISRDL